MLLLVRLINEGVNNEEAKPRVSILRIGQVL